MNEWFLRGYYGVAPTNYTTLVIALLLAFACGHVIAWMYMFTHTGLSYSRSYVNTLILMPVIVALVMLILANNLVLAFGLMAIFAMVRFRSILRDTLDTAYVLAVIVIGLACGTTKFTCGNSSATACRSIGFEKCRSNGVGRPSFVRTPTVSTPQCTNATAPFCLAIRAKTGFSRSSWIE